MKLGEVEDDGDGRKSEFSSISNSFSLHLIMEIIYYICICTIIDILLLALQIK